MTAGQKFALEHTKEEFVNYLGTHSKKELLEHFQIPSNDKYMSIKEFFGVEKIQPRFLLVKKPDKKEPKIRVSPSKGKQIITDGVHNKYIDSEMEIPEGWWAGRSRKGKVKGYYNPITGETTIAESAPEGFILGSGLSQEQLHERNQKAADNKIQHSLDYAEAHDLVLLKSLRGKFEHDGWWADKEFHAELPIVKIHARNYLPKSAIHLIPEYLETHPYGDRHRRQRAAKTKFCKENNCSLLNDLIEKYGQLKLIINDLPRIECPEYPVLKFISNEYIPQIEDYIKNSNGATHQSKQEKALVDFIRSIYDGEVIENCRNLIRGDHNYSIEVDIYIPDKKLAIEYDGVYWHSDQTNTEKNYHEMKSKRCAEKGIRLIHVYSDEWENSREKIEQLLRIALGKVTTRIYARNCEIREITNAEARPFNDANHIQGHRNAQITYGLYHENQLVQLMSFSKSTYNRNLKEGEWEIIRGCPGSNNVVVGGVSKLFKHFVREHHPKAVFSYCDFNKFDGKSYEALGMEFVGFTGPNKWWIISNTRVERNPSKYRELKEKASGAIWGAGSKKYLWRNPDEN